MDPRVAPLTEVFLINSQLFPRAFEDICENDLYKRPADRGNSILWLAGHLTGARHLTANLLRINEEYPFEGIFNRGAAAPPDDQLPKPHEIKAAWDNITEKVMAKLESITDEELMTTSPMKFPTKDQSILGALAFLTLHESYHVGQLAYVRRLLGYSQLVG
jgi:uncharacterized damage-inducible protein DinB